MNACECGHLPVDHETDDEWCGAENDPGEPCIALIVLEKPIVLTGPIGRFFNPLVKRGWL